MWCDVIRILLLRLRTEKVDNGPNWLAPRIFSTPANALPRQTKRWHDRELWLWWLLIDRDDEWSRERCNVAKKQDIPFNNVSNSTSLVKLITQHQEQQGGRTRNHAASTSTVLLHITTRFKVVTLPAQAMTWNKYLDNNTYKVCSG
jgi:hypothetical protein